MSNTPRVRTHTRMCTHTHTEAHSHRSTCLHTCLITHTCPGPCTYTPTHPQTKHIQRMKGSGRRHPQGLACKDTLDRAVAETRPDMQVHAVHGHERLSSMGTCAGQHARKPWTGRLLKPELMGSYVLCLVSSGCYDFYTPSGAPQLPGHGRGEMCAAVGHERVDGAPAWPHPGVLILLGQAKG